MVFCVESLTNWLLNMKLNDEERKKMKQDRETVYYDMSHLITRMKYKLHEIENNRGHTIAFKQLMLSLDGYEQQISNDYSRYVKRIKRMENNEVVAEMQKALNRERTLREKLQKKVDDASISSGLFIKFVRDKLKF